MIKKKSKTITQTNTLCRKSWYCWYLLRDSMHSSDSHPPFKMWSKGRIVSDSTFLSVSADLAGKFNIPFDSSQSSQDYLGQSGTTQTEHTDLSAVRSVELYARKRPNSFQAQVERPLYIWPKLLVFWRSSPVNDNSRHAVTKPCQGFLELWALACGHDSPFPSSTCTTSGNRFLLIGANLQL